MTQTESQIQTRSLRDRIADARAAIEREDAESDAQQAQELRATLRSELANVLGINIDTSAITIRDREPFAEVEGLCFTTVDSYGGLAVVRKCEGCGAEEGKQIFGVRDIAYAERHGLSYTHASGQCVTNREREEVKRTPVEERLLQALRDYIANHSYQG